MQICIVSLGLRVNNSTLITMAIGSGPLVEPLGFSGYIPGGGGGVLRFVSDGGVPLKPPNLAVPIFKGHFGGKGYPLWPLLGVFIQEYDVFVYFSDVATKWAKISSRPIYSKITKLHPMFREFLAKPYPMFRDFFAKITHFSGTPPYTLLGEYPPPPPPPPGDIWGAFCNSAPYTCGLHTI